MIMEKIKAGGIIQNLNLAKIGIMGVPDRFGIASIILGAIYNKRINVQYIVTTTDTDNKSSIILCVNNEDLNVTMEAIETIKSQINAENVIFQSNVAMVSVFGPHFRDYPGIAMIAFSCLASAGINIISISTSISTISCLIEGDDVNKAVEALKIAYNVPSGSVFIATDGLSLKAKGDSKGE